MLNIHADLVQVIHDYMSDPETAWKIGNRAEFSRSIDGDAEVTLDHAGGAIVGQGGAVRIAAIANTRLAPVEGLTEDTWTQAALLCLREFDATMAQRNVLTELGSDMLAARPIDRVGILFDLGVGAVEADYCVRTADTALCEFLRARVGKRVADNQELQDRLAEAEADHVAISRLGRIEQFRTAFALPQESYVTAPAGYTECLRFMPPQQSSGAPFDEATYGAFRVLYGIFADPALSKLKDAVSEGIRGNVVPDVISPSRDEERMVVRITVRQLLFRDGPSDTLDKWKVAFDA